MKKFIIFNVLIIMLFLLTGCNKKTALGVLDFKTKMEGYEISDATNQFDGAVGILSSATIAKSSDGWQIEFYVLTDDVNAKNMFIDNKDEFDLYVTEENNSIMTNDGNYATYTLNSDDYYYYLSRIDNTLLFVKVKDKYMNTVKGIVEGLGY